MKLFAIDVGAIDALPGSTKVTKLFAHPELNNVIVGDLPGLGDINANVSDIAKKALADLDLIINIVNADGGVGDLELENLRLIRETGKPFIVCLNKIDLIPDNEREELRVETCKQMSVVDSEVIVTAFEPDDAEPGEMIGASRLNLWVVETLKEKGKDMLYLKSLNKHAPIEFEEKRVLGEDQEDRWQGPVCAGRSGPVLLHA